VAEDLTAVSSFTREPLACAIIGCCQEGGPYARHPRSRRHRGPPPPPRAPRPTATPEPASPVSSLVQAGIITAAALDAHDDLAVAAASLQRLGRLTSGMWPALGQELAIAAERLDRQAPGAGPTG